MTSVSELVETTRRHLYGTQQGEWNFLTTTINSSVTTLTVDMQTRGIVAGAVLSIDDEIMYVKSISNQTITVSRGWEGSTAAAHTAGVAIEVNARFSRFAVKAALLEEIRSWPATLFYIPAAITLSGLTTTDAYDLTALGTFYDIIEVRREPYSGDSRWPVIRDFEVARRMPTATFASGNALFLKAGLSAATDIRVTYTAPFVTSTFADATDVVATCKLPQTAVDIPPYGAAWRLLAPREVRRTFTESQPEPRTAADVPPGFIVKTAAALKAIRDERIAEESAVLRRQVPLRW